MAHWRTMTERDYIYSYDLQGKDVTLTIERVIAGTIVGERGKKNKKPVAYFKETKTDEDGKKKGLGLNATNCRTIAAMYGDDVDNWIGKKITLFASTTEFGGKTVDCIRVRSRIPAAAAKGKPNGGPAAAQPNDAAEPPEPYDGPPDDYREPGSDG